MIVEWLGWQKMDRIKFYPIHPLEDKQNDEAKEIFIPFEKPITRKSSHKKIRPVKYRRKLKITQ